MRSVLWPGIGGCSEGGVGCVTRGSYGIVGGRLASFPGSPLALAKNKFVGARREPRNEARGRFIFFGELRSLDIFDGIVRHCLHSPAAPLYLRSIESTLACHSKLWHCIRMLHARHYILSIP